MSRVRKCRTCFVVLTDENAYINRQRNTFQSACKACQAEYAVNWHKINKEKELKRRKAYYVKNHEQIRTKTERARVLRKYGLTPEQIEEWKQRQSYLCSICLIRPTQAVDHCHQTKIVRGMLCNHCNTALGLLLDDPEIFRRAIQYLEDNRNQS